MGAKTIALDPEAYELLKAHRRRDETFSEVVKRHFRPAVRLADFAGDWKDLNSAEKAQFDAEREMGRKVDRERAERIRKRSE